MQPTTHWIKTTDQERLCAKTWGNETNPALVLVHGYPDNQQVWEPLIAHLIQDFFIISYDVRGAGQSSIPRKMRAYRLEQLSFDLELVTQNLLGERAFYLIAHDWGSIQSWESVTESRFKNKILAFMSLSGPCLDHAGHWLLQQTKRSPIQAIRQLAKSWYIAAFQFPFIAPTVWRFLKPTWWHILLEKLEEHPLAHTNAHIQQDGRHGVQLYRANMLPRLFSPRQRHAICPVYVVILEKDRFVSPELARAAHEWVDDYHELHIKGHHWSILTQADTVAQLIHQMVEQQEQNLHQLQQTDEATKRELNSERFLIK